MNKARSYLCIMALALALGCALVPVKIAEIRKAPDRYENKVVTIRGRVSGGTKLPFMTEAFYQLDDGSGSITVATHKALPPDGKKVVVRGTVKSAFSFAGEAHGLVILEDGK